MKAIILAAGYGKRAGKLTEHLPKPLIPVVNKPILQHLIESLNQNGVKEFVVAVGYLKNQIISFLTNYSNKGIKITTKDVKDFRKGPIYSFFACMDEIKNEDFILVPADFLIDPSLLSELLQKSKEHEMLFAYDEIVSVSQHTSVHLSKNGNHQQVLGINTRVNGKESDVKLLLPLLICRLDFQPYIKRSLDLNKTKVYEAIQLLLQEKNTATAYSVGKRWWFELDTIEDVLKANSFLLNQSTYTNHSNFDLNELKSRDISLKQPILFGNHCQFKANCTLGPNVSIGDNTLVGRNVKIQNAIICASSEISANTEIRNAIFFKSIFQ